MKNVVIAGYVRSPFTPAKKGELVKVRPDDFAAQTIRALVARTGVDPQDLEDLLLGCAFPEGEQGFNVARLVGFLAGLPQTVAGATVNRFCGSSMQAIHIAAGAIQMNAGEVFVCAGVESMTRVPMGGFNPMPNPALYQSHPQAFAAMGETAENLAKKYGISRQRQEEFAVESQRKTAVAIAAGRFDDEIVPIAWKGGTVERDGCPRPDTTLEGLANLKLAFDDKGTVTAGTSSPVTDGAAATLVCSEEYAERQGLEPLARIRSFAVSGCAPEIMGIGPVASSRKALERAGLTLDQIDVVELNEAFAAQSLACIDELGLDPARVNLDGGAIALGHPLGATGARITGKAAQLLAARGQTLRPRHPVHRRRPGHRHRSRGGLIVSAIERVGVLGAGVMGAGIAAHVANAGIPVVLLDIVPEGATERDVLAAGALEKLKKAKPAALMSAARARLVTPGNLEDHLGLLADCDWIVEAVVERVDIKQRVYRAVDAVRKPGSIVSTNTSTIPLAKLVDGLPASFAADFLVTHFFNPPRYMRLLELVAGPATRPEAVAAVRDFCDRRLGKSVVDCKDTPGFIANRIGTFWIEAATREAIALGLTVEEADAVAGKPFGFPKTGVFGLMDLVGIDLGPHISASLLATLPADDAYRAIHEDRELVRKMIAAGLTGRKGKGGFYRLDSSSGKKVKQSIDLATGEYRDRIEPRLASVAAARRGGVRALLEHPDRGGRYAWSMLAPTLAYAASLVPSIADEIAAVDEAMRCGYSWEHGPFELLDRIGPAWFAARLAAAGRPVPPLLAAVGEGTFYRVEGGRLEQLTPAGDYREVRLPEGVFRLAELKRAVQPVAKNASASLWDLGDGVLCLEFHTKMNALDEGVLRQIGKAIGLADSGRFRALVIYNEGSNFSVGANIGIALFAANIGLWPEIEASIAAGQETFKAMKYAPFPVVGAPAGMALGGGCEILLHCDAVQAHAETYMGLVEAGVGVIPGWGGCKEMVTRWQTNPKRPGGPMPGVVKVFETISTAQVATSAEEAKGFLFLRESDGVTMNRDRLLADAKAKALELVAAGYRPPERVEISLPGPGGRAALDMAVAGFRASGAATPHDAVVAGRLATVVTGGDTDPTETVSEDDLSRLEREAFLDLVRTPATLARIEHMLETGKPLRN